VARNGEPEALLRAALDAYGGLGKLIKPGGTVSIKANFSWYGGPERACNTNPDLLAALVRACLKAGAKKVRVIDLAINPAKMCLESSGIQKAVSAAGGMVMDLTGAPLSYRAGGVLKSIPIYTEALTADCLINVPILKHHGVTDMTGALKSLMGLTPGRSYMHSVGVDQAIVDLNKLIQPHLHIIDAYRVLKTWGPQGPGEVATPRQLILTHDPVAGDAYGAALLKLSPLHLKLAAADGIGCADLGKIRITEVAAMGA